MVSICGVLLICVGVPAVYYVLLVRNEHKLFISEKFRKRFSFIYGRCCCCRNARICASGDFPYADIRKSFITGS